MNTLSSLLSFIGSFEPVGSVKMYAGPGSTPPKGWLFCQGQAVSRADYPKLFSVIGVIYGAGNGSTTFNLPNFCGRTAIGAGSNGTTGAVNHPLGDQAGAEKIKLADAEVAHGHAFTNPTYKATGGAVAQREAFNTGGMSGNTTHTHADALGFHWMSYSDSRRIDNTVALTASVTSGTYFFNSSAATGNNTSIAHTHQVPAHSHPFTQPTISVDSNGSVSALSGASSTRTAHDNMPPYTTVRYIIFAGK